MSLHFEPISMTKQADYLKILDVCPVKVSDASFINLWSWKDAYGLNWAWTPDLVWVKQTQPQERLWAPVGRWETVNWTATFRAHFTDNPAFTRIPEKLLNLWQSSPGIKTAVQASRGHWDYIYSVPELIELKGNSYHKKKNLLNQFKKRYAFKYVPLDENALDMAIAMQENWCTWRDCESNETLDSENHAITKVLSNWHRLDRLTGGAIMVASDMVAYTIAEHLSPDTLLIHFEKGDSGYKGVYQAINQMFLENAGKTFQLVNREQDLDSEGLRQAKLSYNPVGFLKKFDVTVFV